MYEHFTEAAISTIIRAQEESRQAGHNFVAPEQLLLGLLSGGRGLAFKALTQANVTLVAARTEVLNIEPKGSDRIAMEIPFTPASKRILELSLVAAKKPGPYETDTEHVLLAIIEHGDNAAIQALRNLGVDLKTLREDLLEMSR
jgi:ATP-dependent Clp protease ATP-binding subunit ClpC